MQKSKLTPFYYLIMFISVILSYSAFANHDNYGHSRYQSVTLYSDCGFSGRSVILDYGEYRSLRHSRIGNDTVSSLIVPKGMVAIVYEDNNFKGKREYIHHNVNCVPKEWNDRISSVRIVPANNNYPDNRHYDDYGHNDSYGDWRDDRYYDDNYNHNNYDINSHYPGANHNPGNSQTGCYTYRVTTNGGMGAFRLTDETSKVIKVANGTKTGETCRRGNVQLELSKTDPDTLVSISINNRLYTFSPNMQHDKYKNNWYRKYININLP